MDQTGSVFKYLAEKFPRLSEANIKRGFLWVLRSAASSETICSTIYFRLARKIFGTRSVWCQLTSLGISGQKINYKNLTEDMLSLYHKLGCNMSFKIHTLHFHLDFFPDNCGMVSDEHGEHFMRKLQRWRNDIRESGPPPCWLTAVGRSSEMLLSSYTSDRQSEVASKSGLLSLKV